MKNLIQLCVRRPVGVMMFVLFVVVIGLVSLSMLKYDLYPNIEFPNIMVMTTYEGVGPEEVEKLVTRPLESAVSAVPNVKKVTSTSATGSSIIVAECNYGTDMDFTNLKMRERIDLVKRRLPSGVENPIIFKMDPSMMPIIFWGMSSPKGLVETTRLAEDKVKPRLERIPGIASVSITGGLVREVKVLLNADKLAYYKVSPSYISQALMGENMNLPGGTVNEGRNEITIRTIGEFQTVEEIKALKIALPNGAILPLQELAEIKDAYHDQKQHSRINGDASVMLLIMKESDANTVLVTRQARKELAAIQKDMGNQAKVSKIFEQAEFIENSINSVAQNALAGAFLAIIILYLFLRSVRSTLVISIAIPVSIIITFAMIYFSKLTLNLVSMGGLALGVGMLVDNAIVVLESIQRYREEGHDALTAAIEGASEVGLAITASTLTTIIVFAPILFVENIAAQIFKELAFVVSFSLLASLVVALTVIPMISAKIMNIKFGKKTVEDNNENDQGYRLGKIEKIYRNLLKWAINNRGKVVLFAFIAFILGFVPFLLGIKMEFMPQMGQKEYMVDFELPLGTNLEMTNSVGKKIENVLKKEPYTEMVFSTIGSGNGFSFGSSSEDSEKGSIYVMMEKKCPTSVDDLLENARKKLKGMPGVKINVHLDENSIGSGGSPISVNIEGPELDILQKLASEIKDIVQAVPNTREVSTSWQTGRPELQLKILRDRANYYGISTSTIANVVQTSFKGSTATQIRLSGEEYDVFLQLRPEDRKVKTDLEKIYVFSQSGAAIPLKEVVQFVNAKGPTQITRENQTRQVQVNAQITGNDLKKISDEVQRRIKNEVILPTNYSFSMGGQVKDMDESNAALAIAFLLAVLFVYMVIAVQYENLIHPFAILGTLPLTFFGVSWSLYLTGKTFSVTAFIGVIMLAGIVVNNAIVLVDYIETLRSRGLSRREAILKAGPIRLRPVLMTTLTTVLGLLPLALGFGDGGALNSSMAVVVIGGLTLCTLLTLVVIPIVYSLLDDLSGWAKKRIFHRLNGVEYHR